MLAEGMMIYDGSANLQPEHRRVVKLARAASPLDAVFLITDFNRNCLRTKLEPIDIASFFQQFSGIDLEAMRTKVAKLRADENYFGEKRWTGRALDEIYEEMRARHPGFGDAIYRQSLDKGIVSMR
jgi:hypothetical protein